MEKERGGVKDGIKVVSKIIEAAEMLSTALGMNRQAWDRFWYEFEEKMFWPGNRCAWRALVFVLPDGVVRRARQREPAGF
jgi:hypothetical protein